MSSGEKPITGVDQLKPSPARMYDYWLGGSHNFEVDRQAADAVIKAIPEMRLAAHLNRAFLQRVVTYCSMQGIDQFLDIGSGIPTAGNVHQIAQQHNKNARVVYVENDSSAVAFGQQLLMGASGVEMIPGDLREPETILTHSLAQSLIDFSRPVGVLMIALLHFVPNDAEAYRSVRYIRDQLAPGSYIAISHGLMPENMPDVAAITENVQKVYKQATQQIKTRPKADIEAFFDGLELIEPGVVPVMYWKSDIMTGDYFETGLLDYWVGGVGRKSA